MQCSAGSTARLTSNGVALSVAPIGFVARRWRPIACALLSLGLCRQAAASDSLRLDFRAPAGTHFRVSSELGVMAECVGACVIRGPAGRYVVETDPTASTLGGRSLVAITDHSRIDVLPGSRSERIAFVGLGILGGGLAAAGGLGWVDYWSRHPGESVPTRWATLVGVGIPLGAVGLVGALATRTSVTVSLATPTPGAGVRAPYLLGVAVAY